MSGRVYHTIVLFDCELNRSQESELCYRGCVGFTLATSLVGCRYFLLIMRYVVSEMGNVKVVDALRKEENVASVAITETSKVGRAEPSRD